MNRRAQGWSIDVVLAVVIFGFIAVSITSFALLGQPDVDQLQQEAEFIDSRLNNQVQDCDAPLTGSNLNPEAAECLYNKSYQDLRDDFRIRGDFCIFIEDDLGRVIPVDNKIGVGGEEVRIGGYRCGAIS